MMAYRPQYPHGDHPEVQHLHMQGQSSSSSPPTAQQQQQQQQQLQQQRIMMMEREHLASLNSSRIPPSPMMPMLGRGISASFSPHHNPSAVASNSSFEATHGMLVQHAMLTEARLRAAAAAAQQDAQAQAVQRFMQQTAASANAGVHQGAVPPTPPPVLRRMPSSGLGASMQPGAPLPGVVQTNQSISAPSPAGLDLLRSASMTLAPQDTPLVHQQHQYPTVTPTRPGAAATAAKLSASAFSQPLKQPPFVSPQIQKVPHQGMAGGTIAPPLPLTRLTRETSDDGQVRLYIDEILEWDVLCGRGGRSNHHPGNKRYRHVVSDMKATYRTTDAKNMKTDLSRAIVEHVCNYGGRFIKKDDKNGRYYVLTKAEARKKTSQALRETKELKWTL